MTDSEAYIVMNLLSGIGPARLSLLLSRFSAPSAILQASFEELSGVSGIGPALAEKLANWEKYVDLARELELAERGGVRIITLADFDYPPLLRELRDAPLCLYIRGDLSALDYSRALGVVGTRSMSHYGERMTKHLVEAASFAGFVIISGLAYGVDAAAHHAALSVGGRTISVLGGGLGRIQPQDHVPLAREIAEKGGAVISEFPMETSPTRHTFPLRNRIISGLSHGTLVVEAGLNSGSLITANFALEQNRILFAVPGQADDPRASGCNSLIRQGAVLVESFEHILQEFEFLPGMRPSSQGKIREEASSYENTPSQNGNSPENDLPPGAEKILPLLAKKDMSVEELAQASRLGAGEVSGLMIHLEITHKVTRLPSGLYRIAR